MLYQMRAKGEQGSAGREGKKQPTTVLSAEYRDSMAVGERKEMLADAS